MKIAAIYARKSTEQNVADDAKSVTRQVENARAFAAARGWTVDDRFVFMDDGVSGTETRLLRARARMIDAAQREQFDVVVMQSQDRFSRSDGHEAFADLIHVAEHVEVWFYADATRFTYGTFESNVTGVLKGEFNAEFRRVIAAKTHEAMRQRADQGYVTGGRAFGYNNMEVLDANGRRSHVERVVNPVEAAVVVDIFTRYAKGEGFKQIAHALNAQGVPSPRPQRGRPAGWDPGTVRAVLRRPLYRGVVVYDKTKKRDLKGRRHKGRQPKKDRALWLHVERPELRIVDATISLQVDARLSDRRNAYLRNAKGHLLGSPRRHGHNPTRHLLAGFIVCACGATFEAVRGYYVCSARRRKGAAICGSEFSFAAEGIEQTFLDALEGVVLSEPFIERVLDLTFQPRVEPDRDALTDERKRLTLEIGNLTAAIAAGGDIPSLAEALKARDRALRDIDAKLTAPVEMPDRDVLRAALELRTADWRGILRGPHVEQARLVLQHLLDLPIRGLFNEPKPKWVAAARPEGLAVGLVQSVASPPGYPSLYLEGPVAA